MKNYYLATKLENLYLANTKMDALLYHALNEGERYRDKEKQRELEEAYNGKIIVLEIPFNEEDAVEVNKGKEELFKKINHVCTFDMREKQRICDNIGWRFMSERYDSIVDFGKALIEYSYDLIEPLSYEDICSVCLNVPTFTVKNRYIFDSDENFTITLHADNGTSFTTVELLWKLNNYLFDNRDHINLGDHVYFEGIYSDGHICLGS